MARDKQKIRLQIQTATDNPKNSGHINNAGCLMFTNPHDYVNKANPVS